MSEEHSRVTIYPPNKKVKSVVLPKSDVAGWNRIFYRPSQVERCLPCYGLKAVVGLQLAMLFPHNEFLAEDGKVPIGKFYTGKIKRVLDGNPEDPMVEIVFDGNPFAPLGIVLGFNAYKQFMIPISKKPQERKKK